MIPVQRIQTVLGLDTRVSPPLVSQWLCMMANYETAKIYGSQEES